MTQEETNKRNEAIWLMTGGEIEEGRLYFNGFEKSDLSYHNDWGVLMPAYEHIQRLWYKCIIEPSKMYTNKTRVEVSQPWFNGLFISNHHEDLRTAIWLTVSDFAIEFNKLKENGTS